MPKKITGLRIDQEDKERLESIAKQLGYEYGNEGSIGKMLKAISDGELMVIPKKLLISP